MTQLTIITKTKNEDPQAYNTMRFLLVISRPYIKTVLDAVAAKPLRYSELQKILGTTYKARSGITAFYLRKAREAGLVKLERLSGTYVITFKGIKAKELLESISKIANLNMSNLNDTLTQTIISLEQNKSWLEPLLKSEIRKAFAELKTKEAECQ